MPKASSFKMLCAIAIVGVGSTEISTQSLAERVRKHGPIEILLQPAVPAVDLLQLVAESDLIARVRVLNAKSFEKTGRIGIITDYHVDIYDILHQRLIPRSQSGDQIVVRRDGGELEVEKIIVTARDPDFPAFETGEEYVLVLSHDPKTRTFSVLYGGQGAFRLGSDFVARQIRHVHGETPDERPTVDLPLDQLRDRIVALAGQP